MAASRSMPFRVSGAVISAYPGFLAFLSLDVLVRLFVMRDRFGSVNDVAILMMFEMARTITIVACIVIALRLGCDARRAAPRLLGFTLLMLATWYAKAFAFGAFPGFVQEWMAGHFLEWGVSRRLLGLIFGSPEWAAWLALAGFLRLSVIWPAPLGAAAIEGGATLDRAGMMRSVAFAGADVGAAFRRLAARLVAVRAFRPTIVWPVAVACGFAHSLTDPPASIALAAVFATACALGITNLRAGQARAAQPVRWRATWMAQGALSAVAAFLLTGLLSLGQDGASVMASFAVSALAPFTVLMAVASGATARRVTDPRPAIRRTLFAGAAAIVGVASYLLIQLAMRNVNAFDLPIREVVGLAVGIALVLVARRRLQQLADEFMGHADAA